MTVQGAEAGKVEEGLRYGPPGDRAVHLCIDMQRLFDKGSEWAVDWMRQVLPNVCQVVEMFPARTIFTRFIPPESLDDAPGAWRRYYEKWPQMLRQNLDSDWLRLLPELEIHLPGAQVFDKPVYSPWMDGRLHPMLQQDRVDTLILTGGETDICLLAAVIGAVDLGYRVIVVSDAVCSSTDDTHDAAMEMYAKRFGQQIEMIPTDRLIAAMV
ncbi:cysteine hydrolase [Paracoccus acridae]|uniref:Cysteine hydrolase n=1 Tax=Paracoccus acridae TaxID=1795310 RepID=A0ABQ1VE64_9RHOB|nr:isochorismatase family cysteine hydrolase [Paracoccus acridae]GGF58326.1 cysteine hydrolase [Paracoccus acridae]